MDEHVPGGRAIWQSDGAKTYQCPTCLQSVFSQYEGTESPEVECKANGDHVLRWPTDADVQGAPGIRVAAKSTSIFAK